MRGNVLKRWTAAAFFLTALLMAGPATTSGFREDGPVARRASVSWARVEHCAAPAAPRAEIDHAGGKGKAAAMLIVLMAQHARVAGPSR